MGNKDMAWYFGDANAWGIEIHGWSNHMGYMQCTCMLACGFPCDGATIGTV